MKSIDPIDWLSKKLQEEKADLVREMVREFAQALMEAEVDSRCGAPRNVRSEDRTNRRNGYRPRRWDTRAGSIDIRIPRVRKGSYFPDWLLEPRKRAEKALTTVVAEAYLLGVSTRSVDNLVQTMGIDGISKSQVSQMAKSLDAMVSEFRNRPLEEHLYPYLWLDALVHKVREGGRVVNVATLVATAVSATGYREIVGVDVATGENEEAWTLFLRGLVERGLSGVQLVISDAHVGLKKAIEKALPGASWQRCRVHFIRNVLTRVPKAAQDLVASCVRSIFSQHDADAVRGQHPKVVEQIRDSFPDAAELLGQARDDLLAFAAFPKEHWKQIWSNNPQERLNKEIRRRSDVVGIFPNRTSLIRLVGALLAEQHDEWAVARRYMSADSLTKTLDRSQSTAIQSPKEVLPIANEAA